jgi:signal transduction histidine kinase/DNA-binding response OmpR family regulator
MEGAMRAHALFVRLRAFAQHPIVNGIVRGFVLLSMSFAAAFGFLAGTRSYADSYDPYSFAVGTSALFGAACGAAALLFARARTMRDELVVLRSQVEDLSDRNWELREAEERARSLLAAQGDLIVRRNNEARINYVNDAFCALAGRAPTELVDTRFEFAVLEQSEIVALSDGTRMHDQKIATSQGPRWIAWREAPVRGSVDYDLEVQSVGRDLTERVEAERARTDARHQAEAANRAKSRFLAMVSHEIRTPLNGILGMTDLLFETALTPEQTAYAKAVKISGETLLSLIEEILDFSKIEAGRLDIDAKPFDLHALVEETTELLAPRAQDKELEIACDIEDTLPRCVLGDAARLRQVLLNLAGNAIKFTDQGGVAILVERGANADDVRILVRDSGIGIAPHEQERIFLEFEQADSGAARRFAGSGLGLAICKRIIERMGGRVSVESTPGAGATFEVTLPLPAAAANTAPVSHPDLTNCNVMLVAPTAVAASLVAGRLLRWGARTCVVPDAGVAATLLGKREWHAILVDHALGRDACEQIAQATAGAIARRIVLITPTARHDLPALKASGFTGYLIKPVRAASLAARLADKDVGFERAGDGTEAKAADIPTGSSREGLTILIAEDNEINALLARALLTKLGHRPTLVTNGAAAVTAWRAAYEAGAPYDLVLMDIHMPGSDGIDATRQIRACESNRGGMRTPIVALTANAFSEDRETCTAAGMDGFLIKPLDRERLITTIAALDTRAVAA